MKRTPLKRKKPMTANSGLPRTSGLKQTGKLPARAAGRPKRSAAEERHIEAVKSLRCAICGRSGPSDAHHCFHDRFGARRVSDYEVIPLCKAHHQDGPDAIHKIKATWRKKWGPDHSYIGPTMMRIYGVADPSPEQIKQFWEKGGR